MCGIAGKLLFDRAGRIAPEMLSAMALAIAHRGPDDEGVWTDGPIGLGEPTPRRHRPLAARPPADGERWTARAGIVFNGEIYNFQELRAELERDGHRFRSGTDTEVILAALRARRRRAASRHLRGMFAFALWDAPRRRLVLARDRLGKKPLFYYARTGRPRRSPPSRRRSSQDPAGRREADPAALASIT